MARKLSKSAAEFLEANGWSAKKFVPHALYMIEHFDGEIEVGRSVVYARRGNKTVKVYCHHNGRSAEWLTITDIKGTELESIHCSSDPSFLMLAINLALG